MRPVPFDNGQWPVDPSDWYSEVLRSFSTDDASNGVRVFWSGNDRLIIIAFDGPDGRVVALSSEQTRKWNQSPLDNLLWRLKRQWRRWFPE